ncbi:hypothetical protein AX16_002538 [Volvariella volvacea WC 439]|nr:hypothetical protein AX16_002538 [Volvariella volvacea WC 439]
MNNMQTMLQILKHIGDWAPIPLFSLVASAALSVYEVAMAIHGLMNVEAIKSLAYRTVTTTYIVVVGLQHEGRRKVPYATQVESDLKLLLDVRFRAYYVLPHVLDCPLYNRELNKVRDFVDKYVDNKWYNRALSYQADKGAIFGHMEALSSVLTKFGVSNTSYLLYTDVLNHSNTFTIVQIKGTTDICKLADQLIKEQKEFLDSIAQDLMGKPQELTKAVYGTMLPTRFISAISTQDISSASVGGSLELPSSIPSTNMVNTYIGDYRRETSRERVTNINSGRSYVFEYSEDGRE